MSRWMTPGEVAAAFEVDVKTVARWADLDELPYFRLPSGHRRFVRADVEARLRVAGMSADPAVMAERLGLTTADVAELRRDELDDEDRMQIADDAAYEAGRDD